MPTSEYYVIRVSFLVVRLARLHRLSPALIAAVFLFATAHQARAQQTVPTPAPHPVTTVPFTVSHNRVYLPVEVNGKPFEMILDNGAAISGLSEETARALQLRPSGTAKITGNGESRSKIQLAKNVRFRLGAAELREKLIGIEQWSDLELREGRKIDGFLGVNFFRRYVVVLDYPASTLFLYDPASFTNAGSGEPVALKFEHNAALFHAVIEVSGRDPISCMLAVDSGTYSALRLYRPFVEKHHLLDSNFRGVSTYGFGLGGEFPEKLGRVDKLRIGSLVLQSPVTSFSLASGGATSLSSYDGTIGGEVLSRFRVILDYPHQQMLLEPGPNFSGPWEADTSGVILRATDSDPHNISVIHLLDNSPAATAGIKEGDLISSVDQQQASTLGLDGIRLLFTQSGQHHLQLHRGSQTLEVDLTTTAPLY